MPRRTSTATCRLTYVCPARTVRIAVKTSCDASCLVRRDLVPATRLSGSAFLVRQGKGHPPDSSSERHAVCEVALPLKRRSALRICRTRTTRLSSRAEDRSPSQKRWVSGMSSWSGAGESAHGPAGAWSATGSMQDERWWFTTTTLLNGKVLAAAGYSYKTYDLASAELYDSTTGTWSPTGSFKNARFSHTATLLLDGRVLVAGGYNGLESMTSVEIYDPRRGRWTRTGSLHVGREEHMATLLQDGKVLVTGGDAREPVGGLTKNTLAYNSVRFDLSSSARLVRYNLASGQ